MRAKCEPLRRRTRAARGVLLRARSLKFTLAGRTPSSKASRRLKTGSRREERVNALATLEKYPSFRGWRQRVRDNYGDDCLRRNAARAIRQNYELLYQRVLPPPPSPPPPSINLSPHRGVRYSLSIERTLRISRKPRRVLRCSRKFRSNLPALPVEAPNLSRRRSPSLSR